jgi:hypothetical protein
MGSLRILFGRSRIRHRRALASEYVGAIDPFGRPTFLYLTGTPRKRDQLLRDFAGRDAFSPDVVLLDEQLAGWWHRYGDGRAILPHRAVALLVRTLLDGQPGRWPRLQAIPDRAEAARGLAAIDRHLAHRRIESKDPELASLRAAIRPAVDRTGSIRESDALEALIGVLRDPGPALGSALRATRWVIVDEPVGASPLLAAVTLELARAYTRAGADVVLAAARAATRAGGRRRCCSGGSRPSGPSGCSPRLRRSGGPRSSRSLPGRRRSRCAAGPGWSRSSRGPSGPSPRTAPSPTRSPTSTRSRWPPRTRRGPSPARCGWSTRRTGRPRRGGSRGSWPSGSPPGWTRRVAPWSWPTRPAPRRSPRRSPITGCRSDPPADGRYTGPRSPPGCAGSWARRWTGSIRTGSARSRTCVPSPQLPRGPVPRTASAPRRPWRALRRVRRGRRPTPV